MEEFRITRILSSRYIIGKKVAEGSYTELYEAKDRTLNRSVAVKVLKREYNSEPVIQERFKRIASITAALQHPHVIPIFDYSSTEPYIIMPLLTSNLSMFRKSHEQVRPLEALFFMYAISHALITAHKKNIIHGNLSPSNVLVANPLMPLLSDFAIDHKAGTKAPKSLASSQTMPYLSPEQWKTNEIVPQTDQYTLALITYFLLSGKHLSQEAAQQQSKQQFIKAELFRDFAPEVTERLIPLLRHCLASDPAKRLSSMLIVVKELEQLLKKAYAKAPAPERQEMPEPTKRMSSKKMIQPLPTPTPAPIESPPVSKPPVSQAKVPERVIAKPEPEESNKSIPAKDRHELMLNSAKNLIRERNYEQALTMLKNLQAMGYKSYEIQRLDREANRRLKLLQQVEQLVQESLLDCSVGNIDKAEKKLLKALSLDPKHERSRELLQKLHLYGPEPGDKAQPSSPTVSQSLPGTQVMPLKPLRVPEPTPARPQEATPAVSAPSDRAGNVQPAEGISPPTYPRIVSVSLAPPLLENEE